MFGVGWLPLRAGKYRTSKGSKSVKPMSIPPKDVRCVSRYQQPKKLELTVRGDGELGVVAADVPLNERFRLLPFIFPLPSAARDAPPTVHVSIR